MKDKTDKNKWRSKWKRSAAERRAVAAASLADVFVPRRGAGLVLLGLLALSLGVHDGIPGTQYLSNSGNSGDAILICVHRSVVILRATFLPT